MDYRVKPIGTTCAATGEPLVPGSTCYSVLIEEDGELKRCDYSQDAWTGPPAGAMAYWRRRVPQPPEEKPRQLNPDELMACFEQLCEDANPARDKLRYVVALLLLRKRRLTLDGSRQEGETEYLQLSGTRGEGPYEVRDYQLAEEEVNQLGQELQRQMTGASR